MDQQVKKLWLKELRDPKRRQARHQLCSTDGAMCCLGVLCDIAYDGDWEREPWDEAATFGYSIEGGFESPPTSLLKAVGLPAYVADTLMDMNDILEQTFPEIADYIEAKL